MDRGEEAPLWRARERATERKGAAIADGFVVDNDNYEDTVRKFFLGFDVEPEEWDGFVESELQKFERMMQVSTFVHYRGVIPDIIFDAFMTGIYLGQAVALREVAPDDPRLR